MKKTLIRIFSSVLALSMVIGGGILTSATESTVSTLAYEQGKDLYLNVALSEDGRFLCVGVKETETGTVITQQGYKGEDIEDLSVRSYPEKQVSKTFSHKVYSSDGVVLATFYISVTGVYSEIDREALIESITGEFRGTYANSFTYSPSYNGNTATVNIYFNGMSAGSFRYKLSTNGVISNY